MEGKNSEENLDVFLSKDSKKIYENLRGQAIYICSQWKVFSELFVESKETIDLLNEYAPEGFWIIQESMADDLKSKINRLIDNKKTGKYEHSTIEQLIECIKSDLEKNGFQEVFKEFEKKWEEIKIFREDKHFRKERNERISHLDLNKVLNDKIIKLRNPEDIKKLIELLSDFFQLFNIKFFNADFHLTHPPNISISGLIYVLEIYREFKDLAKKKDKNASEVFFRILKQRNN